MEVFVLVFSHLLPIIAYSCWSAVWQISLLFISTLVCCSVQLQPMIHEALSTSLIQPQNFSCQLILIYACVAHCLLVHLSCTM